MPLYLSVVALEERYSEERVTFAADEDGDDVRDPNKVERALADAEAEVNSYLAKVYTLPLPGVVEQPDPENNANVPPELPRVVADIAMYRLVPEHDRLTKERRRRYEDAIAWLKMVCEKKAQLTVTAPTSSKVTRHGPDRIFTRDKMDGLL